VLRNSEMRLGPGPLPRLQYRSRLEHRSTCRTVAAGAWWAGDRGGKRRKTQEK